MILPKIHRYFGGDLTRNTVRFILLPLIFVSYFGILALAAALYPDTYDWRYLSISKLLYPLTNPRFHYIASASVAATGLLMAPFAGYIRRRLGGAAPRASAVGAALFFGGCLCLTLAGLIASHPLHGTARFPQLHNLLARISVIGIGLGIVTFNVCATIGYCRAAPGTALHPRRLILSWNLLTLPIILITLTWLAIRISVNRSTPAYHTIAATALWKVGFWEWIGSIVVFAFLVYAVLLLPEHDPA
ncbi:MAG TPA: hypothetical protein VMV72_03730 [Verrucomicrobiae bacterium]|nr:hypothetical protein [Verrucomicrobiae bacterium]